MLIHYSRQSKLILLPNKSKDDSQQSVMVWKGKKSSDLVMVGHIVAQSFSHFRTCYILICDDEQ